MTILDLSNVEGYTPCPEGYYSNKDACYECDVSCVTCSGGTYTNCDKCPDRFYNNKGKCDACDIMCKDTCSNGGSSGCNDCADGYYANSGSCEICNISCITITGYINIGGLIVNC